MLQLPPDAGDTVLSFDISPQGRVAVVTLDGRLIVDGQPYDGRGRHARQRFVDVRWSPDGRNLAYIVETPNAEALNRTGTLDDGVWLIGSDDVPRHILRNNYGPGTNDFPRRIARALAWAPDNDALLISIFGAGNLPGSVLTGANRKPEEEGNFPGLFRPLQFAGTAWLPDSQGWYAVGIPPEGRPGIYLVDRDEPIYTPIFESDARGYFARDPARLLDGRYAFLGKMTPRGQSDNNFGLALYVLTPGAEPVAITPALSGEVLAAEWSPNRLALLVHTRDAERVRSFVITVSNGTIRELPNGSTLIHWTR